MREKPRDAGRLLHILHSIDNINRFIDGKTIDDFGDDTLLYFGVVKNLEIVGEAAYMLTGGFKDSHPETPWKTIVGMRHYLVHGYYHVDSNEVWNTTRYSCPEKADGKVFDGGKWRRGERQGRWSGGS